MSSASLPAASGTRAPVSVNAMHLVATLLLVRTVAPALLAQIAPAHPSTITRPPPHLVRHGAAHGGGGRLSRGQDVDVDERGAAADACVRACEHDMFVQQPANRLTSQPTLPTTRATSWRLQPHGCVPVQQSCPHSTRPHAMPQHSPNYPATHPPFHPPTHLTIPSSTCISRAPSSVASKAAKPLLLGPASKATAAPPPLLLPAPMLRHGLPAAAGALEGWRCEGSSGHQYGRALCGRRAGKGLAALASTHAC